MSKQMISIAQSIAYNLFSNTIFDLSWILAANGVWPHLVRSAISRNEIIERDEFNSFATRKIKMKASNEISLRLSF